jgi:hypothetical protein
MPFMFKDACSEGSESFQIEPHRRAASRVIKTATAKAGVSLGVRQALALLEPYFPKCSGHPPGSGARRAGLVACLSDEHEGRLAVADL